MDTLRVGGGAPPIRSATMPVMSARRRSAPSAQPAGAPPLPAPRPALPDRTLGAHLPLGAGMVAAVERADRIGADAIQVFADNPTAWRRRAGPPAELPAFRRRLAELAIGPLAVHAAYLANLAGPDPLIHERSVEVLTAEMDAARAFGARFVVVHVGSHRGSGVAAGVERVADAVVQVVEQRGTAIDRPADGGARSPGGDGDPILVLENSAGAGAGVGATIGELAWILAAAGERGVDPARVGVCLDTAHLWGAGVPIGTAAEVDALVEEVDAAFGLARLAVIHLNDSRVPLGSLVDRHQHLGAGQIGCDGLARFLTHPRLRHATYYLETPGMDEGYDAVNIARARALALGLPLQPLPPEALDLRSGADRTAPAES
jgi:deoxyribonuclease IV